jgi:hypothetical protein
METVTRVILSEAKDSYAAEVRIHCSSARRGPSSLTVLRMTLAKELR